MDADQTTRETMARAMYEAWPQVDVQERSLPNGDWGTVDFVVPWDGLDAYLDFMRDGMGEYINVYRQADYLEAVAAIEPSIRADERERLAREADVQELVMCTASTNPPGVYREVVWEYEERSDAADWLRSHDEQGDSDG